jgi:hypothetical protein
MFFFGFFNIYAWFYELASALNLRGYWVIIGSGHWVCAAAKDKRSEVMNHDESR